MFTIFAVPKPFKGHTGLIQENAIKSWTHLNPKPEIILIGNEEGTEKIANELGLLHILNVEQNEYGTPLYNSIFKEAINAASSDLLCHVTADAILFSDFIEAVDIVCKRFPKFLALVEKRDCEINEPITLSNDWEKRIKSYYNKYGKVYDGSGSDIFLFPKSLYKDIPPFTIGRAIFDNWLIYHTIKMNVPTVVIKKFVSLHQSHEYLHHQGGKNGVYYGKEAKANLRLAGGNSNLYTIRDCKYELSTEGLQVRRDLLYAIYRWIMSHNRIRCYFIPFIELLRRLIHRYKVITKEKEQEQ